jgi:putative transposase
VKVRIKKTRARQQRIEFSTHGGKRRGAGRKRSGGRRRVPHRKRPRIGPRTPVHITLRCAAEVPQLRNFERCKVLRRACCESKRDGFRLCESSIQGNHLHLVCEADSNQALARGMQGFKGRVTKGLNRLCNGRKGSVWDDRYHLEVLRTPRQVRNALAYVLNNWLHHGIGPARPRQPDPFSSGRYFDGWATAPPVAGRECDDAPVAPAEGWLLTVGWRQHGLIEVGEVPGPRRRW